MKKKLRVGVIGGGSSSEREVSLLGSRVVAAALPKTKYAVALIDVGKDSDALYKKIKSIDVAFLVMHGRDAEDGRIQGFLEMLGIPYTGSGIAASALAFDKARTQALVSMAGVRIPKSISISKKESLDFLKLKRKIRKIFSYPIVVKPNASGSSIGVSIVKNETDLLKALAASFKESEDILLEQYIAGREFSCAVMGNSGQTNIEALPPIEIISEGSEFFDYKAKYFSKTTQEICPAPATKKLTALIKETSVCVHELLGCDGLTRSDFMLDSRNNLYFLEINTIPGQTEASLAPKAARAHGLTFAAFLEKQIILAIKKHNPQKIR